MMTTETHLMKPVRVWDLPTRVGHWLLACTFFLSYLTGDSEEWRLVHAIAGFALAGILVFRAYWGFAGTRYARFRSFLFAPRIALAYLRGLLKHNSARWIGHNPVGSYAIHALLLLGVVVAASGIAIWFNFDDDWVEEIHELSSSVMLAVVGMHVVGVIVSSVLHRENLIRSMINGRKAGLPGDGIDSNRAYGLLLLFAAMVGGVALAFLPA
ncbi:MAG: cytochrome b/b6 domain-containing protein [Gallionellaceae bacterium]|jgi:cytochrome b|nr:cytochrome b/b6 domain-containing protein [Gallionellaceae bacterium]